jgi:hypothetical protein
VGVEISNVVSLAMTAAERVVPADIVVLVRQKCKVLLLLPLVLVVVVVAAVVVIAPNWVVCNDGGGDMALQVKERVKGKHAKPPSKIPVTTSAEVVVLVVFGVNIVARILVFVVDLLVTVVVVDDNFLGGLRLFAVVVPLCLGFPHTNRSNPDTTLDAHRNCNPNKRTAQHQLMTR